MNRSDIDRPVPLLVKCRITCLRFGLFLTTLLEGQHIRQSSLELVVQILKS